MNSMSAQKLQILNKVVYLLGGFFVMKKVFTLLLVVATVFFAGMSFAEDTIKIGAMYALTGALF